MVDFSIASEIKRKKVIIFNDTSSEPHHGCGLVMENIIKLLSKNKMQVICTNPTGLNWKENQAIMESIPKCDLILVNGEGTLHHAQSVAKDLISIAKYVKLNFKIPVVLINSTYQDNGDEIAEQTRYFDLIYVRETRSKDELSYYGINSEVVPDMTFYSKFDLTKKTPKNLTGVTDSVYREQSEYLFKLALRGGLEYLPILTFPKIKRNIRGMLSFLRFLIFRKCIPILCWSGYSFSHRITKMFFYTVSYEKYIKKIADQNFMVIARYHTLCFALKTLTPFLCIELNSFRMKGLLEDIGIDLRRVTNSNKFANIISKKFSLEEEKKILSYVDNAPDRIESMFSEISGLIKN